MRGTTRAGALPFGVPLLSPPTPGRQLSPSMQPGVPRPPHSSASPPPTHHIVLPVLGHIALHTVHDLLGQLLLRQLALLRHLSLVLLKQPVRGEEGAGLEGGRSAGRGKQEASCVANLTLRLTFSAAPLTYLWTCGSDASSSSTSDSGSTCSSSSGYRCRPSATAGSSGS